MTALFRQMKRHSAHFPGIGPYTASAVVIFAYNKRAVAIETNIRTVVAHHCHPNDSRLTDADIVPVMEQVLCEAEKRSVCPRDLYAALMDYGAHLKQRRVPSSRKNTPSQKKFDGSVRQARGIIIRMLLDNDRSVTAVCVKPCTKQTWTEALDGLVRDGMIVKQKNRYVLFDDDVSVT